MRTTNSDSTILSELHPFFYPRAIAVVGVSSNLANAGSSSVRALQRFGFRGPIYPINPRITELFGLPVFPSVSEIPGEVDFARIYVPSIHVLSVVRECRDKGIPAVEVFTSGFSETGTDEGKKLEVELSSLAGNGMRIIGPNCFGVYSPGGGVTHISGENYPRESGSLGFFSQSGGLSEDFCRFSRDHGLNFSQAVSYGNACDVNELDMLRYFEVDPNTSIIAAYIEGVKNGREFLNATRRLAVKKPLIIWKAGLTPTGARSVTSHTGSLAGSEKVWAALFRQTGAIQVHSLEELLDTTSALYHLPPQTDPRVALVCGGGGIGVALSDASYREGLTLAHLSDELQQKIASFLTPLGTSSHNPIDVGAPFPPTEALKNILETLASSNEVGSIVLDKVSPSIRMRELMGYTEQIGWEDQSWLTDLPVEISKKWEIPVIVVLREGGEILGELSWEAERRRLRRYYQENGVAVYPTAERALKSLGRMVRYYQQNQAARQNG